MDNERYFIPVLQDQRTHGIVPFIVNDNDKRFYAQGLSEWQLSNKKDRLMGVCSLMQEDMIAVFDHFKIKHEGGRFEPEV